ncbi:hypothetical protein K438DRAFT_1767535 [Mycena galopus ATCC 62051]|nr:hypothetical protein K438DRAFT_1767535 [Mycena galopus ATCC 62051]
MRGVGIHFLSSLRRAFKLLSLASQPSGRAVLTILGIAKLQISCFTGGPTFDCSMFITAFCNSIGNSTRCFNNPAVGSSQCTFTAANMVTTAGVPNVPNCGTALATVDAMCPPVCCRSQITFPELTYTQGGSGMFSVLTFRFWMDLNDGMCGIPELDAYYSCSEGLKRF